MNNPYRTYAVGQLVSKRSWLWRFRLWLALVVAPKGEDSFVDRWDITDDAKRLALAFDRGYVSRIDLHPLCIQCGAHAPIGRHCRECGSYERYEVKSITTC